MMKAKKVIVGTLAAVVMAGLGTAQAADVTAAADLASAYVFRGATVNDGLVLQPSVEIAGLPVDIGVWGNLNLEDDDARGITETEFSEIDIYGSYTFDMEGAGLTIGYTEYTYPAGGGSGRELSLGMGLDAPFSPSLTVYYGIDGAIDESFYIEAAADHSVDVTDEVSVTVAATVAYASPDDGKDGMHNATVSASTDIGLLTATVTWIGQLDDDVLEDASAANDFAGFDAEFVGSIGVSTSF